VQRLKAKADIIETETILQVSEQIQMLMAESEVPEDLGRMIVESYDELDAETPAPQALRFPCAAAPSARTARSPSPAVPHGAERPAGEAPGGIQKHPGQPFTPRAIAYRLHMGIPFTEASMRSPAWR